MVVALAILKGLALWGTILYGIQISEALWRNKDVSGTHLMIFSGSAAALITLEWLI